MVDSSACGPTLSALRERGAHRFDPVRFHFMEALARRAVAHEGPVKRLLDGRLAKVLAEYAEQYEKARSETGNGLHQLIERFPDAAEDFRRLYDGGDFKALRRLAASLEDRFHRGPLAELVREIARSSPNNDDGAADGGAADEPAAELKALRYFRSTWAKLNVGRQLTQSLAKVPKNAGPLNSHLLVLRSLEMLRDVSPEYLHRFMSYVDALLWLELSYGNAPPQTSVAPSESDKKRKPSRGRPG